MDHYNLQAVTTRNRRAPESSYIRFGKRAPESSYIRFGKRARSLDLGKLPKIAKNCQKYQIFLKKYKFLNRKSDVHQSSYMRKRARSLDLGNLPKSAKKCHKVEKPP